MKVHCNFKDYDKYWYVHIHKWRGIDNVHTLFRGDSDPMLLYRGRLYDLQDVECSIERAYEEDKDSWEDDNCDEPYPYENVDEWFDCFSMCAEDWIFYNSFNHRTHCKNNFGSWYNYNRYAERNKNKTMKQHLSQEEKRVLRLAATLPDISKQAIGNQQAVMDEQWDAHNCSMLTFGQTIQDYQVLRVFDVEMEWVEPEDRATEEELKAIEEEEEKTSCYDEAYDALINRLYDETGDPYHEYEVGECVQYWLNVLTGEVTMIGKVWNDNPRCCDFDAKWEIIRKSTERGKMFRSTFEGNFGAGHYKDLSVHPLLIKRGYSALDAMDWYYGCGEEENKNGGAKFFDKVGNSDGNFVNFMQALALGVSPWEQRLKQFGMDELIQMCDVKGRISDNDYLTAIKICKRNHYTIEDRNLWNDMLVALIDLQKDIHNAHYVCPADLHAAHDRWVNLAARKKDEIRKRKAMEEAIKYEKEYAERLGKFMNCSASNDNFNIFVCPTVADMAAEGAAMHHCVYKMGYYKSDRNCIILLVRDKAGNRIATSEVKMSNWSIAQTRGKCNQLPTYNDKQCLDEINALISNVIIPQFREAIAVRHITNIINITNHTAEQAPLALAA